MRAKSKSRARTQPSKTPGQEFFALGSNRSTGASTLNTNKASFYRRPESGKVSPSAVAAARARSRSSGMRSSRWDNSSHPGTTSCRNTSPFATRMRTKSAMRELQDTSAAIHHREHDASVRRSESSKSSSGNKRERSKSKTRERNRKRRGRERSSTRDRHSRRSRTADISDDENKVPKKMLRSSRHWSRGGSDLQEIENAIGDTERELKPMMKQLEELKDQLKKLQKRVETKEIEIYDLQVDLDALRKRRERRLPSHHSASSCNEEPFKRSRSKSERRNSRRSKSHVSKRPCIVDEDDESSDDDCVIVDKNEVKEEAKPNAMAISSTVVPIEDSMPDHFWGRSTEPKLLANYRFRAIPDGSVRKGRHLAFNPIQPQIFATSPDEGGLILWSYQRQDQDISKVVTLTPPSFRRDNPCAESIAWSPDGNRMAMAFRDPVEEKGEFCVVQLHQLKLEDSDKPQPIPRDRITSKCTTLHSRGISAIDWLPSGFGSETTSHLLVTTGNSDHAVVLWEEHEVGQQDGLDFKFNVLHRDHRSEVKSLCVHSKRECLFTGGLDGLLIRYDLNKGSSSIVMERRKPNISKINSILEHPHNPNMLLVSSVEQSRHDLLLYDLRQRYDHTTMSLTWEGTSMSQYVVPRWSPAGYHVSCGSKTGVVNIWDVRMRGENYPRVRPHQSLRVHHKTVLHATWHPRYDAMFSVSHDRTLGLLTFR
ncbi:U5 snRNP-specific protein-like factor and related proteins [Plasmopara halstedii]|uniref:U5 snRNP-specific protein-like factor and related proteins n=1 Tax=Plasmopara halstedii TaxID=4781 RepID=A0A0P1AH19_PLAHL|nr:U5 snRNP-specific protein-like factor and related proteins [Plasmopara halstedii]CEG39985.1 U5 snRNP-specific protein-like factor and related proteins [Plasmopara halstedii]|eukprot:XP_024576354.1 U5 snRNP-specific protein-like factor and related proteins [Plasmopara halstedii]